MVDTVVIQSTPPVTPEDHDQKMVAMLQQAMTPLINQGGALMKQGMQNNQEAQGTQGG